jgi:hypothetical protein
MYALFIHYYMEENFAEGITLLSPCSGLKLAMVMFLSVLPLSAFA